MPLSPRVQNLLGPFNIFRQRKIGIRLVNKFLPWRVVLNRCLGRLVAILYSARGLRKRIEFVKGIAKLLLEPLPLFRINLQFKRVAEKITRSSILVQTTDQISNRVNKVFLATGRSVKQ